jgi:uncharacterized protein with NRDE domain
MCLVLVLHDAHPQYRLILAANRDEFYDRPTSPAAFWTDTPAVLAGRDLRAGGTWLGIDRSGRFAAVTNYRQGEREVAASRSRGLLVSEFLTGDVEPEAYLGRVARDAPLYNGFNLLVGDGLKVGYFSNREGVARVLAPGLYGLSNHLLDTPWPKVTSAKLALSSLSRDAEDPTVVAELFALLADRRRPAEHLLPETGIGREWERLLSSAFIASPEYGTRSSTVVLMGRDQRVRFVERRFGTDGVPGGEVTYDFSRHH